jgi:hypothetical protein
MRSSPKILSGLELSKIHKACSDLANAASGSDGIVDVGKLCNQLNARIVLRPLLVEGMLARAGNNEEWLILLNSEEFPTDALHDLKHPKSVRLRSTVAHELLHVLSFHGTEFGVDFNSDKPTGMSKEEYVERIEKETDKFASLLLLGQDGTRELFKCRELRDFQNFMTKHALSRYLLIQRLNHAKKLERDSLRRSLNQFALGIIKEGRIQSWPLFYYYENGIVPEFIHNLTEKKLVTQSHLEELADRRFSKSDLTLKLPAGTPRGRNTDTLDCRLYVEDNRSTRLFLINPNAVKESRPTVQLDLLES